MPNVLVYTTQPQGEEGVSGPVSPDPMGLLKKVPIRTQTIRAGRSIDEARRIDEEAIVKIMSCVFAERPLLNALTDR